MIIEIITTKKKLTLSVLKQMYGLPFAMFKTAEILGFISAGKEHGTKKALCKNGSEYYLLDLRYERRGNYAGYNGSFRGEKIKRLDPAIIDDWFAQYEKIKLKADRAGHIYI